MATLPITRTNRLAGRRTQRVVRPLLAAHVRRYWPALLAGSLLAVLQVVTKLAEPWPLGWLVDNALTGPAARRSRDPNGPRDRGGQLGVHRQPRRDLRLLVDPAAVLGRSARCQRHARPGVRPPESHVARLPQAASGRRSHGPCHSRRRFHPGHAGAGARQPVPQPAAGDRDVRGDADGGPLPDTAEPHDHPAARDRRASLEANAPSGIAAGSQGRRCGRFVGDGESRRDRPRAGLHAGAAPVGSLRGIVGRQLDRRCRGRQVAGALRPDGRRSRASVDPDRVVGRRRRVSPMAR